MAYLSGRTALTTVQTSDIADDAVTLAKMAGGTDGNLIGIDASGDPAYIATGDDGQVLTSGGAGVAALMEATASAGLTIGAEVAIASGSSVTISSIPSGVKEVHLFIEASSLTAQYRKQQLEFGDSGGLETSGYKSSSLYGTTNAVSSIAYLTTSAEIQNADGEAATNWNYVFDMYLKDETNNTWMWSYQGGADASASARLWWRGWGAKSLSSELTQMRLFTDGTWDGSGVVNISYM